MPLSAMSMLQKRARSAVVPALSWPGQTGNSLCATPSSALQQTSQASLEIACMLPCDSTVKRKMGP